MKDAPRHAGTHARRAPVEEEPQLPVSIILVAGLALVHVVMAASLDSVSTAVIDLIEPWAGLEPARLVASVTPWVPLVVVLFIWTREQRQGLLASAVALAFATLAYLRGVVAAQLLDRRLGRRRVDGVEPHPRCRTSSHQQARHPRTTGTAW